MKIEPIFFKAIHSSEKVSFITAIVNKADLQYENFTIAKNEAILRCSTPDSYVNFFYSLKDLNNELVTKILKKENEVKYEIYKGFIVSFG